MNKKVFVFAVSVLLTLSASAFASIPTTMNFQGRWVENGMPVTGQRNLSFSICDDYTLGGSHILWTSAYSASNSINIQNGVFSVMLGNIDPAKGPVGTGGAISGVDFNKPLYIEVSSGSIVLSPRQVICSTPYSFNAVSAETAGSVKVGGSGGVPIGTILPWAGYGTPPSGYLFCDGDTLSIYDYDGLYKDLYNAIGNAWGGANSSSFNVPDLRGMFLRGWSENSSNDPDKLSRTPQGLLGPNAVGSYQNDTFSAHSHTFDHIHHFTHEHSLSNHTHDYTHTHAVGTNSTRKSEDNGIDDSKANIVETDGYSQITKTQSSTTTGGPSVNSTAAQSNNVTDYISNSTTSLYPVSGVNSGTETRPKNAYVMYIIRAF